MMSKNTARHEFRLVFGPSLLGTGDMRCLAIKNEYNYRLNSYFTIGAAVQVGSSESFIVSSDRLDLISIFPPLKTLAKVIFASARI